MLRRVFVFFVLFSFLVCFFAFSVSAASYNYTLSYVDGDGYLSIVDSIPTSGTVNYNITASILDFPGLVLTSSGTGVLTPVEVQPGMIVYFLTFTFSDNPMPLVLTMASLDGVSVAIIDNPDNTLEPGYVFDVSLSTVVYPAFEESTSSGLSSALLWINEVIDYISSSGLWKLICIPISIAILLVAAKFIRSNSWGL